MVMVPKKNGKWKMCRDFMNLNKACPNNDYLLPRIDTLVDAATGSEMMSMLDCFFGYRQIWIKKSDEDKTSSHPLQHILLRQDAGGSQECRVYFQQNSNGGPRDAVG
jgi:hypothetical protein